MVILLREVLIVIYFKRNDDRTYFHISTYIWSGKYIERCSRSLFGQTYFNIEYIFVDDCTKDNSIGILKKF